MIVKMSQAMIELAIAEDQSAKACLPILTDAISLLGTLKAGALQRAVASANSVGSGSVFPSADSSRRRADLQSVN